MYLDDFHKTEPHSLEGIPSRSVLEIGPNELTHECNFFSWRLDHHPIGFVHSQRFGAMNEHPLDCDVPRFPCYRSVLRYNNHRPPDFTAREFSVFSKVAQRSIPRFIPSLLGILLDSFTQPSLVLFTEPHKAKTLRW